MQLGHVLANGIDQSWIKWVLCKTIWGLWETGQWTNYSSKNSEESFISI